MTTATTAQSQSGGESLRRYSAIELLIAIVVFFVFSPFIESLRSGPLIESILFTVVLVSAVLAIAHRRRTVVIAAVLALTALTGRWMHHFRPDLMPPELFLIAGIFAVLFVIIHLLRFVLTASEVDTEVLCASISAYLLLGLLWTFAYWLVAELIPDAFAFNGSDKSLTGFNGFYFSFITLSTVGYGDITPIAKVARMLAAMEAMTGLLYVATLIARLVAIQAAPKSHEP
jgi:putative Ca2+/H+ antiporter (TMEM165/GDT1 family)